MGGEVLVLEGVSKRYGRHWALRGVSLRVSRGEVLGLVGPNGAGKSTLIRVSLGIASRDGGVVLLNGRDPLYDPNAREGVGVVFERPSLPGSLPVRELLRVAAAIKGAPRDEVDEVIEFSGLSGHEWKRFGELSAGLKQRAAIAHAMLGDPELLVADEPTSNLDPVERVRILELLARLNRERGLTVIVSSHVLYEVLRVSGRIALLREGRLVRVAPVHEVVDRSVARVRASEPEALAEMLRDMGFQAEPLGASVLVRLSGRSPADLLEALARAERSGLAVLGVDMVEPSIEEALSSG